jgi:putative ABC transport system permease protein
MTCLPLANLTHWKLRSALSAAGIAIGVAMLLTLTGLSRGTVNEVADRWEAVDAELIACPRGWGGNVTGLTGPPALSDRHVARIQGECNAIVEEVVPVLLCTLRLGGQDQLAAGVEASQWHRLAGGRGLSAGRLFDPNGAFAQWLQTQLAKPSEETGGVFDPSADELESRGGLELVIDERLASRANLHVGDAVEAANHRWRVVGVVPAGGMTRVCLPRRTAQFLFGSGSIGESTLLFVKLRPGADARDAARRLRALGVEIVPTGQYRGLLQQKLSVMYVYVNAVNAIAMAISFLFIMVTLYTMVLQRTREIAILRSLGASRRRVLGGVLAESLILTGAGTAGGIAMALLAGWLIQTFTLYTVAITAGWVVVAILAACAGAILAGLYPAWRATRVDVVEALSLE